MIGKLLTDSNERKWNRMEFRARQYFTFLSEEGCEYLKDYLNDRIREGEKFTPKSSIITPKLRMKPFIRAGNIGDVIRESMRAAGLARMCVPKMVKNGFNSGLPVFPVFEEDKIPQEVKNRHEAQSRP